MLYLSFLLELELLSIQKKEINGDPYIVIEMNDQVTHVSELGNVEKVKKRKL